MSLGRALCYMYMHTDAGASQPLHMYSVQWREHDIYPTDIKQRGC